MATNANGELVWTAQYKAYGSLALAAVQQVENNLRFQGQYYDEESGLNYNRFRYYDPECGRFINQDPIGLLRGNNNYLYVPNPVTWVDPWGLICKEIPGNYDFLTDTYNYPDKKHPISKRMDEGYMGEQFGTAEKWKLIGAEVEYFSPEKLAEHEVFVKDGRLFFPDGMPVDSISSPTGKAMFVMDPQGKIYMSDQRPLELHHSSFFSGGEVAAAVRSK